jgi:acyl-CoA thioester hydrolase
MDLRDQFLSDFPVVIELPVVWGEMDAFGHVNNIIYFRYFESARLAYFQETGYLKSVEENKIGPILASTSCAFKRPLKFPDKILVGTRVPELGKDRFPMLYRVVSESHQNIAAEGKGLIVSYNYSEGKKIPIPEQIWKNIESIENRSFPKPE